MKGEKNMTEENFERYRELKEKEKNFTEFLYLIDQQIEKKHKEDERDRKNGFSQFLRTFATFRFLKPNGLENEPDKLRVGPYYHLNVGCWLETDEEFLNGFKELVEKRLEEYKKEMEAL